MTMSQAVQIEKSVGISTYTLLSEQLSDELKKFKLSEKYIQAESREIRIYNILRDYEVKFNFKYSLKDLTHPKKIAGLDTMDLIFIMAEPERYLDESKEMYQ